MQDIVTEIYSPQCKVNSQYETYVCQECSQWESAELLP